MLNIEIKFRYHIMPVLQLSTLTLLLSDSEGIRPVKVLFQEFQTFAFEARA